MTSDTYLPRVGGGEYHVFYLAQELHAAGHTVHLCVTEPSGEKETAPWQTERLRYKGWRSLASIMYVLWKRAQHVDIIHAHYSYRLGALAAVVSVVRRKPFLVTQHGLGLLPQAKATFVQKIWFVLMRWISQYTARFIISTSEDLSIDIRSLGFEKKIVPITNGYDDTLFQPLPPTTNKTPVILTVRRLVPKNGIQYLIAALPKLRERFPDLRYIAVGDGRLRTELEAMACSLQVQDMITFVGAANHAEILTYYRQASVVVIPSTAESTSLSCIEAMALEKPIVASRVGGLVELIGKGEERGWLVPLTKTEHCDYSAPMSIEDAKIDALAAAIGEALTNENLSHAKTQAASAYARKFFPWKIIAQKTIAVYERMMRDEK